MKNNSVNFCKNPILSLINKLPRNKGTSKKRIFTPQFVFLCGKGILSNTTDSNLSLSKTNRGAIKQYLANKSNSIKFAISEELWEDSAYTGCIDLLSFEEFLADVSKYIILLVESMGSSCELGAFSSAENGSSFIKKMIIILDKKHKGSKSFISTGPVMKAKSAGATVIYADLEDGSVMRSKELLEKLDSIVAEAQKPYFVEVKFDKDNIDLYAFILEIIEILQLLQPIGSKDIIAIYKYLHNTDHFNLPHNMRVDYVFNFLEKTHVVKKENGNFRLIGKWDFKRQLFSCTLHEFYRIRSLILAKRFKYKDWNYCHELPQ